MKTIVFTLYFTILSSIYGVEVKDFETVQEFYNQIELSDRPVVVTFKAAWCEPCKRLRAEFGKIAPEYEDSELSIVTIDADIHTELRHYLIQGSYPTTRVFHRREEIPRTAFLGYEDENYLRPLLNALAEEP